MVNSFLTKGYKKKWGNRTVDTNNKCVKGKEMVISPEIVVTSADYDVSSGMAASVLTLAATSASATNNRLKLRHVQSVNEKRRSFEDNLAAIFMGFVSVFLICHFPRLFLNIHELIVMEDAMKCQETNQEPFSLWSLILINVSHFLLVLNSSTNILVYCFMSSKFRKECSKFHLSCKNSSCCNKQTNGLPSSYSMSSRRKWNTVPSNAQKSSNVSKNNSMEFNKQYLKVPSRSSPLPSEHSITSV